MVAGGQQIMASDVTFPAPVQAGDGTDQNVTAAPPGVPGSPVVGVVFTAPVSGRVRLHLFTALRITTPATGSIYAGVVVRAGNVIGSGAQVFDGLNTEPGCRTIFSGYIGYMSCQASAMLEGLVAGNQYNAQVQHFIAPAGTTASVLSRQVGVDPLP